MKIRMFCVLTLLAGASAYVVQNKEITSSRPTIVSREEWGGRPPKAIDPMINPVSHVIIHHSYIPPACNNPDECIIAVKEVQDMHMDQRGWNDGGYSFLAGGDGRIYESRGWNRMGAHAVSYNNRSIGICILGDWQVSLPPKEQLQAAKNLIAMGVNEGYISPDYILLGHRQTRPTECPGQALYNEINTWPHYSPCPPPVDSQQNTIGHPSYDCPESKKSRQTDGKQ